MFTELTAWDVWALLSKLIAYLGCFIAIGSTLYTIATPELQNEYRQRMRRIILAMVVFGAVGSLAQIVVQAGRLLDEGIAGMLDTDMLMLVGEAPLGNSVFIRLLGLTVLAAFALQIPVASLFGILGAALTASSFSLVGHGTGEPGIILETLVTLHLLGISFWIGALWPLRKAALKVTDLDTVASLAHRFGTQATWIVGGLILAGVVLAILITGSPFAIFTTQYGLTLIAKITVVGALLTLAAVNKLRLVPAIQRGELSAAIHLRRSIAWEMLTVLVILTITAVLTTITPLPEPMDPNRWE